MSDSAAVAVAVPNLPALCKCGAGQHGTNPQRCANGHPLKGNFIAVQNALRTERLPPEFAHLAAELEEFVTASITDDGGPDAISHRRKSLHGYRARLHRRVLQLDAAIELRGLFDKRGKLRVQWLQQLQSLMNAAKGIDSLLGLERRQKRIPDLADVLAEHEDEHGA
jgi:hypothetical protein